MLATNKEDYIQHMAPRYSPQHDFLKAIGDAPISDTSKRVYLERWKVLLSNTKADIFTVLTSPKKYIAWIQGTYDSLSTQKSYLSAVLAMFRHNEGLKNQRKKAYMMWYAAFQEVHDKIDERYRKNQPSEKQVDGYVPFEDIVKARDRLSEGSDERLLLALYTYIPPLRCDFNHVRIYSNQELPARAGLEKNYVHLREKAHEATMVLREFKTSKMDSYEKELPEALVKEILQSLEKNPREYLFEDKNRRPYRASSFNKWANRVLQRVFGRNLTISLIRHSFINSLDFNKITVEEKENIAKDMTHTIGTQDRYRLIFDRGHAQS